MIPGRSGSDSARAQTSETAGPTVRLYALTKRVAFAALRVRQPVRKIEGRQVSSERWLRAHHIGDPARGQYFLEQLYGGATTAELLGHAYVGPRPADPPTNGATCDVELVEINRLYVPHYRRAGFFTIPEWVEFGRPVEPDEDARYAQAGKSLRYDLRMLQRAEFAFEITREIADFDLFYERMYRPFVAARFGTGVIEKSRARVLRDFRAGFLVLVRQGNDLLAGGVVRVGPTQVSLTTTGVWEGSAEIMRSQVSAALDYHVHAWAAEHGQQYLWVGHTRPLPTDGVFFNKRKWLMRIRPDYDGVANLAVRWQSTDERVVEFLDGHPFVYQGALGLGVCAVHRAPRPLEFTQVQKLVKQTWTEGLASLILVCPGGVEPEVPDGIRATCGAQVHICPDFATALRVHAAAV